VGGVACTFMTLWFYTFWTIPAVSTLASVVHGRTVLEASCHLPQIIVFMLTCSRHSIRGQTGEGNITYVCCLTPCYIMYEYLEVVRPCMENTNKECGLKACVKAELANPDIVHQGHLTHLEG
jgi:hypothetical protein